MESDLDSTPEFEQWLAADHRHRAALRQVRAPWDLIGEQQNAPELLELRRAALASAREAAQFRRSSSPTPARALRWHPWKRVAAAAATIALVSAVAWYRLSPDTYRTGTGEARVVLLADGSQLRLDSATTVTVAYSTHARSLELQKGQARFDVAHDVERPFTVLAAGRKVVATGTAFDVDLLDEDLTVTLIEGHVVVLPPSPLQAAPRIAVASTPQPASDMRAPAGDAMPTEARSAPSRHTGLAIELSAGEQLVVPGNGTPRVAPANIERTTAWQNGQLVFDNERLATVVQRVNRYAPRPLILDDARAAALRISGVFNTRDVDGLVDTLTRYLPIDAERNAAGIRLHAR